ncbi:MAG: hypothetical protein ACI4MN_06190 [Candidatus Coproplasma sp.]
MESIVRFFDSVFAEFATVDFALLFIIDTCAYALIFLIALLTCALSQRARSHNKRPFLYLTDLFCAITLVVFLGKYTLTQSVAAAAAFRCAGLLCYGLLHLFKPKERFAPQAEGVSVTQSVRSNIPQQPAATIPAVQSGVRLDHALTIADKLLVKNLGRGDRQELEKIKTALTILKVKGTLSVQEGENLNETFNTLLKLMAKYDL